MAKFKALAIAGGALLAMGSLASAADLLPPPPVLEPALPMVAGPEFGGWYLRGDVGVGAQMSAPDLKNTPDPIAVGQAGAFLSNSASQLFSNSSISASTNFDVGVGYQFNSWFRADITGEYRGGSHFQSLYTLNDPLPALNRPGTYMLADFYRGNISSFVGLVNGYVDLGAWYGITPYVGAGLGLAHNTLSGMTDQGFAYGGGAAGGGSGGYFSDGSKTSLAWALMAGLDFNVSQNLKLELGYRYLNYGSFTSGGSNCLTGGGAAVFNCPTGHNFVSSKTNLASNDVHIGLRWMLGDTAPPPPAPGPLVRKY